MCHLQIIAFYLSPKGIPLYVYMLYVNERNKSHDNGTYFAYLYINHTGSGTSGIFVH